MLLVWVARHSWINKAVGPGTRGDPSKLPKYGPYTYKPGAPRPKQNVHGEDLHPAMFMRMSLMGYHVSEPMLEVYKAAGQKARTVEGRVTGLNLRDGGNGCQAGAATMGHQSED